MEERDEIFVGMDPSGRNCQLSIIETSVESMSNLFFSFSRFKKHSFLHFPYPIS